MAQVPLLDQPHLRRPVSAAWLVESRLLAVANQRSGSISIVDIEAGKVVTEVAVGERLAYVADLHSTGWLLAVDEARHELLLLEWDGDTLRVADRIPVSRYPVSIAVSPDGSRSAVVSLWSRTITTFGVKLAERPVPPTLTRLGELALSFAPRGQIFMPDGEHLLVADAFTGQMVLLDVTAQSVNELPTQDVFRIYGLALTTDFGGLYVGHQSLRTLPASLQVPGALGNNGKAKQLANFVGEYSVEGLLNGQLVPRAADPKAPARRGYFREDLRQMAELAPAQLTLRAEGRYQVLAAAEHRPLVLVRRFSDEIVVSDPDKPGKETRIKLGPVGTLTAADRGEAQFYESSLSANGWVSCHTCHPDGHTTGQLIDTLGDGSKGTHKRALTLLGSGQTGRWAWSGDVRSLHVQVDKSLRTTMGKKATPQTVNDITAFLQTLPPPPPLKPASDDPADRAQLNRGESLFRDLGCADCHDPANRYTSDRTYDVGLRDEKSTTRFNPPSLLGVSQGYSFFHDGRANTLADVFITHRHPDGEALPADELADLLRFLSSL